MSEQTILHLQNLLHTRTTDPQPLLAYLKHQKMYALLQKYFPNETVIEEEVAAEVEIGEEESDEEKAKLWKGRGKEREGRGDMVTTRC